MVRLRASARAVNWDSFPLAKVDAKKLLRSGREFQHRRIDWHASRPCRNGHGGCKKSDDGHRWVGSPDGAAAFLVGEQKGQRGLQHPRIIVGVGPYGVVIGIYGELHGLLLNPRRLRQATADRDGPFFPACDPVGGDVWRRADRPSISEMIADKGVQ